MLHEAFVSKTKAATFKTVLFAVSLKDKIDPHILLRVETKLDRLLENFVRRMQHGPKSCIGTHGPDEIPPHFAFGVRTSAGRKFSPRRKNCRSTFPIGSAPTR
jgi:hypothetical protein